MDACPDLPMELVKGNCDWDSAPDELIVEAGGVKFLLTHGHRYGVKSGTDRLAQAAREKGVNVACFGHTHEGLNMPDRGVWLFNPGTAGGIHNRAGYGVVIVSDGKFRPALTAPGIFTSCQAWLCRKWLSSVRKSRVRHHRAAKPTRV